jgi:hypothetical protein
MAAIQSRAADDSKYVPFTLFHALFLLSSVFTFGCVPEEPADIVSSGKGVGRHLLMAS